MVKQMLIISCLLTLAAGLKKDNENLPDSTRGIADCDKTCYMESYAKGYTLGYARYKCCLDKNSKLGIPVTMQHEKNSQKLNVSINTHLSCDMECYNSYFALGYSPAFADQECCYSSSSALNKNSRGSSLRIQLIDASATSDLNIPSFPAGSSDPNTPSSSAGSSDSSSTGVVPNKSVEFRFRGSTHWGSGSNPFIDQKYSTPLIVLCIAFGILLKLLKCHASQE